MMMIIEPAFMSAELLLRVEASHGIRINHGEHLGEPLADLYL